jgi:hypothetical protein
MADKRPRRIFLSGNCQMQFLYDALRALYRGRDDLAFAFRASYRAARGDDDGIVRAADVHVVQVTNLAEDPWREAVPARARRINVPLLGLPGVFHAFAPRIHPEHPRGGRPPHYLGRGNRLLNELALRHRGGAPLDPLVAEYLGYRGAEIENAPRLLDMNIVAMRRIARRSDFDVWRRIEPALTTERLFWSVQHPTRATAMLLLRGVIECLGLDHDEAALTALAQGPEYHEPYHAPVHPAVAARLGLAWGGCETRYRFFQGYFTAASHARRYIGGDFAHDMALNQAIQDARRGADPATTAALFRAALRLFPPHGQADFWYGRVLHRQGRVGLAALYFRRARDGARNYPHAVPHRADASPAIVAAWLRRCRREQGRRRGAAPGLATRLTRLETEERRLLAQIRRLEALRRLSAARAAAARPG